MTHFVLLNPLRPSVRGADTSWRITSRCRPNVVKHRQRAHRHSRIAVGRRRSSAGHRHGSPSGHSHLERPLLAPLAAQTRCTKVGCDGHPYRRTVTALCGALRTVPTTLVGDAVERTRWNARRSRQSERLAISGCAKCFPLGPLTNHSQEDPKTFSRRFAAPPEAETPRHGDDADECADLAELSSSCR